MTRLTRWEPFREMMSLRNQLDRLLEETLPFARGGSAMMIDWDLALNVVEKKDEIEVKASLPGMKPEEIEVTLRDNVLTISGETKHEEERKEETYHLREMSYGKFSRSISLPVAVKDDKVEAIYDQGILTLHLPKSDEVKAKQIPVHGNGQQTIAVE